MGGIEHADHSWDPDFTDAPLDVTISPDIRVVRIDDLEASLERSIAAAERVQDTRAEHEGDPAFRARLERVRERDLRDRLAG